MSTTRKRKAKVFRVGDVTLAVEYKVEKVKNEYGKWCSIELNVASLSGEPERVFSVELSDSLGQEERLLNQYHKLVDFFLDAEYALGNLPEPKVEKKDDTNEG